jgi:hypothetical protein
MPCYDKLPELKRDVIAYYQKQIESQAVSLSVNAVTGALEIFDPTGEANKNGMNDTCILAGLTLTPKLSAALYCQGIDPLKVTETAHAHGAAHDH